MSTGFLPLLSYVLISTFTPGPSNISSASVAVLYGYRYTLRYQMGLAAGVFLIMACTGWISATLLRYFPLLEPVLRYVGAAYILYLAYSLLKASYVFADTLAKPSGFLQGFLLQVLNPKLIVYAFTVFTAFLAPVTEDGTLVVLAALFLAVISFGATSLWAVFGTAVKTYLRNPRLKTVVNIILAFSLASSAIALAEIVR